jgi:type IV fimbrial biogenesis protein FimT
MNWSLNMKGTKGFTVLELLMTIVIGTILLAVAVPSYLNMIERNAISTASNDLLSGLLLARSEAIRQELSTTFTPSGSGWQVVGGGATLLDHTVDNHNVTISGNVISYNPRGRAGLDDTDSFDISYDGTVKSRVCVSLTGRPFIRSADDGACP